MLNLDHTNSDRQYFTLEETSHLLNLTIAQVRRYTRLGYLNAHRVGNTLWVTKNSIEDYLAKVQETPNA